MTVIPFPLSYSSFVFHVLLIFLFPFSSLYSSNLLLQPTASNTPKCRDLLPNVELCLHCCFNWLPSKLSMLKIAIWIIFNFCRGKSQSPFNQVKHALPALACVINSNDKVLVKLIKYVYFTYPTLRKTHIWYIGRVVYNI